MLIQLEDENSVTVRRVPSPLVHVAVSELERMYAAKGEWCRVTPIQVVFRRRPKRGAKVA